MLFRYVRDPGKPSPGPARPLSSHRALAGQSAAGNAVVSSVKITGAQIRAARAFLKWNIADLAKAAEVGDPTVRSIEKIDGEPSMKGGGMENTIDYRIAARAEALARIVAALEKAGITFLPTSRQGVGLRGKVG